MIKKILEYILWPVALAYTVVTIGILIVLVLAISLIGSFAELLLP
jgi:hypothetical protein